MLPCTANIAPRCCAPYKVMWARHGRASWRCTDHSRFTRCVGHDPPFIWPIHQALPDTSILAADSLEDGISSPWERICSDSTSVPVLSPAIARPSSAQPLGKENVQEPKENSISFLPGILARSLLITLTNTRSDQIKQQCQDATSIKPPLALHATS